MSTLKQFVKSMHDQAAEVIGKEDLAINGKTIQAVLAEQESSLDFQDARNEPEKRLQAVVKSSDAVGLKINMLAQARGESWRLDGIQNQSGTFATLTLSSETRA